MTARAQINHRRLVAVAWLGSAAVHAAAVVLLSVARIAPPRLQQAPRVRFFEVQLEQAPIPRVIQVPRPEIAPAPKIEPRTLAKPRAEIETPQVRPRHIPTLRPGPQPAPPQPRAAPRQPSPRNPKPAIAAAKAPGPPRMPPQPAHAASGPTPPDTSAKAAGPSGGGGAVDLGSPSPAGDLGGLGSGSMPVGAVPGSGTGSGSGTGPGTGPGPPGTAQPGGKGPPEPQPAKTQPGQPGGQGPEPPPKPAHVSRIADRALPELTRRVNPQYPASAAAEGVEGTVRLVVTVGPDGSVEKVSVSSSSGDKRLDSAAVAAVRKWKYKPAVQDGVPRKVDTSAIVTFRLN